MIDLELAKKEFQNYLRQFDCENEKIRLKIIHTEEVVRCASQISLQMGLSQEDQDLAKLIALLHDIGRFEQVRLYDSFEPVTMDHAAFGVELLFGNSGRIRRFVKEDTWDEIIRESIARHSAYTIGELSDARTLLHAKLIRDADKLDNCRVKLEDSIQVLLGTDEESVGKQFITDRIWETCLMERAVVSSDRVTRMDYWVSYVAYFYDINFPATFSIIAQNRYVDRIIDRIPYQNPDTREKMEVLRSRINAYINAKAKE